jgi:hypothetical protein
MTDDLDPRDELASAHLDGEATADEAAQVAADPDLAARVAALAAVRDAVATDGGPVDAARRDQAIAAALAASGGGTVVALDAARRRARRRVQLAGVAAALVIAAAIAVPALTHHDRHATTTAASLPKASDDATAGGKELGPQGVGGGATTTTTAQAFAGTTGGALASPTAASLAVEQLGSYPDLRALASAIRDRLANPGAPAAFAPPDAQAAAQSCITRLQSSGATGEPIFAGTGTVAGRPVVAIVLLDQGIERLTTVTPAPACATLASTRL